ncbi:MAG: hypothetical protein H7Z37_06850 [Pyrinomonadaceae bacterium]|nr:hypothetical protein [Pyrinomonadaceae bacterium]
MQRYLFSELSRETVKSIVDLQEAEGDFSWLPDTAPLDDDDVLFVNYMKRKLQSESLEKTNEATVWGKAIYPLLDQAETHLFAAWSQLELKSTFNEFLLEGIADGILGKQKVGYLSAPYLVVVEAKKKLDAKDPQPQLYGAMLAAAKLNFDENKREPQTIHGCYTIADTWTFMRGEVSSITDDKPVFKVQSSREFVERFEAEIILGVLKAIVATYY